MVGRDWHEYWASGGSSGIALADPAQRAFLAQHWHGVFTNRASSGATIIDVACGDGAIFDFVRELLPQMARWSTVIALDASDAGVRSAMRTMPDVRGVTSDAGRLPFREGAVDLVVSQFGLEYAGQKGFEEAARVLKPGGSLSAVCHHKQGSISAECAENLRILNAFFEGHLADYAKESLSASYASRYAPTAAATGAEKKFQQAVRRLTRALGTAPNSAAKVAVASAVVEIDTLAMRRMAYDSTEALAFVDKVRASLATYRARMRSMLNAALDQTGVNQVLDKLSSAGLTGAVTPVSFTPNGPLGAWCVEAQRA